MIKRTDFLPKLTQMSDEQRTVFVTKVIDFQSNILPALSQQTAWDDELTKSFDTGLRLISVMPSAQSFCLVAYQYRDIRKRIDGFCTLFTQLVNHLVSSGDLESSSENSNLPSTPSHSSIPAFKATRGNASIIGRTFTPGNRTGKVGRPTKPTNIPKVPAAGVNLNNTILVNADGSDPLQPTIAERPKHLDQYIHLLPEALQAEAINISDLYTEMNECSHALNTLCDDPKSTQKDRAFHAVKLCNIEDKIINLWARIDAAYAEATGKTITPEYKHYLDSETLRINGAVREKALAEMTKFEIDSMPEGSAKEAAKAARINRDKKFLRKNDRKGDEQHRQNLQDAATELHAWGILITDTQADVCRKYGYEVPTDWIELPLEERKKQQQQARNEKRKAERAQAREERKAHKAAEAAEAAAPYRTQGESLFQED